MLRDQHSKKLGFPFTGSPRRCGGQGDVLAGLLGTFAAWSTDSETKKSFGKACPHSPLIVAALGASMVILQVSYNVLESVSNSEKTFRDDSVTLMLAS